MDEIYRFSFEGNMRGFFSSTPVRRVIYRVFSLDSGKAIDECVQNLSRRGTLAFASHGSASAAVLLHGCLKLRMESKIRQHKEALIKIYLDTISQTKEKSIADLWSGFSPLFSCFTAEDVESVVASGLVKALRKSIEFAISPTVSFIESLDKIPEDKFSSLFGQIVPLVVPLLKHSELESQDQASKRWEGRR